VVVTGFKTGRTSPPGLLLVEGPGEARPGMSGGGLFSSANGALLGLLHSSNDSAMQVASIAAIHIRTWLEVHHQAGLGAEQIVPPPAQSAIEPPTCLARTVFVIGGVTQREIDQTEQAALRRACFEVGKAMLRSGAQLVICSPFPDAADYYTALGYALGRESGVIAFHSPDIPRVMEEVAKFSKNYERPGLEIKSFRHAASDESPEHLGEAWRMAQYMALRAAQAVVAIGGKTFATANTLLLLAEAEGKPIVPFGFLGGAAKLSFDRQFKSGAPRGVDIRQLETEDGVNHVVKLINGLMIRQHGGASATPGQALTFFISRSSRDAARAKELVAHLTFKGHVALEGDTMQTPGAPIEAAITRAMDRSDIFIALWSQNYALSPWCAKELNWAAKREAQKNGTAWIFNLDGSAVVAPEAEPLRQLFTRTWDDMRVAVNGLLVETPSLREPWGAGEVIAPKDGPLRLLIVTAQPRSFVKIPTEAVAKAIKQTFELKEHNGQLVVDVMEGVTLRQAHSALGEGSYHVVHFIGGHADSGALSVGTYTFDDDKDSPPLFQALSRYQNQGLAMVVLQTCGQFPADARGVHTSTQPGRELIRVVIRHPAPDESLEIFARHFYLNLADGETLRAAATVADLAIAPATADGNAAVYLSAPDVAMFSRPDRLALQGPG
jgi:hypothetical protein